MNEKGRGKQNFKAKLPCFMRESLREYDEFSEGFKSFSVATNCFLSSPLVVAVAAAHAAFHLNRAEHPDPDGFFTEALYYK